MSSHATSAHSHPPRILISCGTASQRDSRNGQNSCYQVNQAYCAAVQRAGGLPLLLPHLTRTELQGLTDIAQGILVTGGDFDIPPSRYQAAQSTKTRTLYPERTAHEELLIELGRDHDIPTLGVCGGMQLLNVVQGGTLYQDQSERPGTDQHEQPNPSHEPHHPLTLQPSSQLAAICGPEPLPANSTHHQLVHTLGQNVVPSAHSSDGVIEAIELQHHPFMIGVQWHPELLTADPRHQAIYDAFVAAAARSGAGQTASHRPQ